VVARGFNRRDNITGTEIDDVGSMANDEVPTVDSSLELLSEAVGKACVDMLAVKTAIDAARADIASRNTSLTRDVIRHAEHAIDHLRGVDRSLRDVLNDLKNRD
jgi:hypothetical protein